MTYTAIIDPTITTRGVDVVPLKAAGPAKADGQLLIRLQRRDPEALAELYDQYGGVVYRLILRIVRDTGIAEDLVQETFLRAWNRIHGFDSGRGAVGPWLLAVARNCAIDYLRAQGRRSETTSGLNESEHPSLFVDLSLSSTDFDLARQVKRAMEPLTAQQRQAIELAYFEGMSQTEIAERLGQPLGTVKTWMRRAMQQMRQKLGFEGAENS